MHSWSCLYRREPEHSREVSNRPSAQIAARTAWGTSVVNAQANSAKGKPGHLAKASPVPPFQTAVSLSSSRDFSDQPKPRAWQISGDLRTHRNKLAVLLKSHRAAPLPDEAISVVARLHQANARLVFVVKYKFRFWGSVAYCPRNPSRTKKPPVGSKKCRRTNSSLRWRPGL
jgi:hypothetical protein